MRELPELLAAVDAAREEIISLHQDIVRIPTVNSGQMPISRRHHPLGHRAQPFAF